MPLSLGYPFYVYAHLNGWLILFSFFPIYFHCIMSMWCSISGFWFLQFTFNPFLFFNVWLIINSHVPNRGLSHLLAWMVSFTHVSLAMVRSLLWFRLCVDLCIPLSMQLIRWEQKFEKIENQTRSSEQFKNLQDDLSVAVWKRGWYSGNKVKYKFL